MLSDTKEKFWHIVIQKEYYEKPTLLGCFKRLCTLYPFLNDVQYLVCSNGQLTPINMFKPGESDPEPQEPIHRGYWNIVKHMELAKLEEYCSKKLSIFHSILNFILVTQQIVAKQQVHILY